MKLPHPLYWAGSSLEFTFTGSELRLSFDTGFTHLEPWISAELNGAPLLLRADFRAVSQSGWGVCSGWDGDVFHAIPPWYENTRPLRDREPDVIIINLGTNGANAIQSGEGPVGPDGFEEGALAFLRQLRAEHPAARLVWAYGMLDDPLRPQLERAMERFGDGWYLPLPAVTAETMGSRQHPGPLCHRAAAEATAEFLRTIL